MLASVSKLLSITIFLLLIQGCRFILVVPEGGSVVSTSGSYDCAAEETCIIDLPGIPFAGDTFTAIPDEGYVFKGWNKQEGRALFCGGKIGPCALPALPTQATEYEIDGFLEPVFEEFELQDLLPATTRGVFQIYPGAPGAMDTAVTSAPWSLGPLPLLEKYSAGMNVVGTAGNIMLAQLSGTPEAFILVAQLDTPNDVATLLASVGHTALSDYQGKPRWEITATGLELTEINSQTLAIGSPAALIQALDTYAGAADSIERGSLSGYLGALNTIFPNSFVYGLPALYNSVTPPGTGNTSLSQARAVNSVFQVNSGELSGALNFFSDSAETYRAKLLEQLVGYPAPTIYAIGGEIASVALTGLSVDDDIRPLLKTLIFDMNVVDYADAIVHGGNPPFLNFLVGVDPNSMFINFEFKDQQARDDFELAHLPVGFSLAPIRILDTDIQRYFLVLNMYQSGGGLVNGARAEWSVFVSDPLTGEPRFLVVQAAADEISADSVNLLTFPEPVTHELTGSAIESYVGEVDPVTEIESLYFSSTINWPQSPETLVQFNREFVVANDFIFWGNGVADHGFYNSTVFNRDAVLVDSAQFSFTDDSVWAAYVNTSPVHALVYLGPLEIVASPWWNLTETYLDIILEAPGANPTRTQLLNFKNGFYPGLVQGMAQDAIRGEGLALAATTSTDSVPTASYHFPLLDAVGLLTEATGPGVHTPVAVELYDGEAAGLYLTLNVYKRETDTCGTRAEWLTYVAGSDGRPEALRLDSIATEPCLNAITLMTVAADVSQDHNLVSNTLDTLINSQFVQFDASVDLDLATGAQAGLNRLESGDRVCSLNNICDEFFIDGQQLMEDAHQADGIAVIVNTMATPWDSYVDMSGARADVRLVPADWAMNPWRNLRTFAAPIPVP
ncbi:MAG: hypothetical protein OSA45_16925 [Halioglobus sp.]|nr:hypothetical protein [Halioglobus sp.]